MPARTPTRRMCAHLHGEMNLPTPGDGRRDRLRLDREGARRPAPGAGVAPCLIFPPPMVRHGGISSEGKRAMTEQTTAEIAAKYRTLREFMRANFEQEEFADIAYGIDGGFAHFTYTADLRALYEQYHEEIWQLAREMADEFGQDVNEFIANFGGGGKIDDHNSLATWLVWFAAEQYAREFSEAGVQDDDDTDDD